MLRFILYVQVGVSQQAKKKKDMGSYFLFRYAFFSSSAASICLFCQTLERNEKEGEEGTL